MNLEQMNTKELVYDADFDLWVDPNEATNFERPYWATKMITSKEGEDNFDDSPIYDKDGNYLGVDSEGFTGDIIIMDIELFSALRGAGMDHRLAVIYGCNIANATLSSQALSNIYTDILEAMTEIDISDLYHGKVSIYDEVSYDGWYNNPSPVRRYSFTRQENKININKIYQSQLNTVEIIQSYIGIHEWLGHKQLKFSSKTYTHHKIYQLQLLHRSFDKLPKKLQNEIRQRAKFYE